MSEGQTVMGAEDPQDADMEDRVLATLGIGPKKAPAPKVPPIQAAPEVSDEAEPEQTVDVSEHAPDNLIEIDFKGGKYKLPSELKDLHEGYLRQEDYTRKTQEVAERQRVIDLMEQQTRSQRELQQVAAPYLEQIMQINSQLSHYAKVDWAAYSDQDPQQANKHWMAYQSMKERKQAMEQEMQGAAAQHLQKLKESADRLRGENSKILTEKVKGWSNDREQKVRDFAVRNYGFSQQEVGQVFDARVLRMMNAALELDELRSAKPIKQAAPAPKTLKPSATVDKPVAAVQRAELRKEIRSAKTEAGKARGIQKYLERAL